MRVLDPKITTFYKMVNERDKYVNNDVIRHGETVFKNKGFFED